LSKEDWYLCLEEYLASCLLFAAQMYFREPCQSHGLEWIFPMEEYDVDDLHAYEKRLCLPRWPPAAARRVGVPENASLELEWQSRESKSVMPTVLICF